MTGDFRVFEFGEFELDEALKELRKAGEPVHVGPRVMELLHYLLEHHQRVVPKEELLREIWQGQGTYVADTALSAALRHLRRALGDDSNDPRWIRTGRKRGYRFIGEVRIRSLQPSAPEPLPLPHSAPDVPAMVRTLPPLPRDVVGRERDLEALRGRLLAADARLCAVHGWPGVGKSTLAALLARDDALARRFEDGVLWSSLGPSGNPEQVLQRWAAALHAPAPVREIQSAEELSERLAGLVAKKQLLFVVDDVWERRDFALLHVAGERSATLVTTRIAALADEIAHGTECYRLGVLSNESALQLFARLLPRDVEAHRAGFEQLVEALEGLPLAIHVAAGLLKAESRQGFSPQDLLKELVVDSRRVYTSALPSDLARDSSPTVGALIQRSTDRLDPLTRERFTALGVLEEKPAVFDVPAARAIWAVDDPRPTLGELVDRGLVEWVGDGRYQIHALLRTHAEALLDALS